MLSLFRDLQGDDPDARRKCFVTTEESTSAEHHLARISEELRDKVQSINTSEGAELTEMIRRVRDMKRHELVLLVGTKGSGKSTFIDRFFEDALPVTISSDCVVVRVDLAPCGCESSTIIKWLDEHLLESAERATFDGRHPTYDELEGIFWKEYERWRTGHAKPL
jgi:hypothetical protein